MSEIIALFAVFWMLRPPFDILKRITVRRQAVFIMAFIVPTKEDKN